MKSNEFDPCIVTTTSDDRSVLVQISQQLVSRNLAACVQISGPITSCYRWAGKIETTEEWLCLMKTSFHRFDELESVVLELHNYDRPQLVAQKIQGGNSDYLQWLAENLT